MCLSWYYVFEWFNKQKHKQITNIPFQAVCRQAHYLYSVIFYAKNAL